MPGRNHSNRYFVLLCDALEQAGARIVNVRDREARTLSFDVLHLHFPTHFITQSNAFVATGSAAVLGGFFLACKLARKKIVYTVHNVIPFNIRHEWLLWPYLALVHRLCDAFVFPNESSRAEFYERFPSERRKRSAIVPLSPLPAQPVESAAVETRRVTLRGSDGAFVVGFLGAIKRYKGMEALLRLPQRLPDGRRVRVVVAGSIEAEYATEGDAILSRLEADALVRIARRLSDEELDELTQAVDVVLLPYSRGWNSSAAYLALSNRARILCSDLPVFVDLARSVGRPWVTCYERSATSIGKSLPAALEEIATVPATDEDRAGLARFLDSVSFASAAEKLLVVYGSISAD